VWYLAARWLGSIAALSSNTSRAEIQRPAFLAPPSMVSGRVTEERRVPLDRVVAAFNWKSDDSEAPARQLECNSGSD
jgi:hypothetical protein